jgi:general secretion pathway protein E
MSFEIAQLRKPGPSLVPGAGSPRPNEAGFAQAFADLLVGEGLIDGAAVSRARRAAEVASERLDLVLVKLGLISEDDLCIAYAAYCGLPLVGPGDLPDRPVLADRLKLSFLKANRVLPIAFDGKTLLIAAADPFMGELTRAISYMLDVHVDLAVITPAEIERALRALYNDAGGETHTDVEQVAALVGGDGSEFDIDRLRDIANEAPVIRLVNQIISRAVERRASDIHIEPGRDAVAVRYRIDGFLQPEQSVPTTLRAALTTRIKIMAKLDIAERRMPHDGRIKTAVRGVEIDIRVSTLPTSFGESIVMRILDRSRVELDFTKLGLDAATQSSLQRLMSLPNGIVLVTGPTGSGKTTTLYTALKHLNRPELKLFTVEDPIEYQLSGINQIQVQPLIGLDFPVALRSILRQDPDIIMIGEIRDLETARIAIQAALTGHLVFSTLHTNSAVAAITRLIDIGLERFLLASTISGVMAQRLVRRLCQVCARPHTDSRSLHEKFQLALPEGARVELSRVREPVGCESCGGSGYSGRTTVCELLVVDDAIREAIGRRSQDQRAMEQVARAAGFHTLYEDGLAKVIAGETSLEEVLRVTRVS